MATGSRWTWQCALCAFALLQPGLGELAGCADGGSTDTCVEPAEDSSLVQLRLQRTAQMQNGQQDFPDFGKWARGLADAADSAASKAADAVSNGVSSAEIAVGNSLNKSLAMMAAKVKTLQTEVTTIKSNLTSGVASALVSGGSVVASHANIPLGEEYEAQLNSTLGSLEQVWKIVDDSAEAAVNMLVQGFDAVGLETTASTFNDTMQAASTNAKGFVASLGRMKDTFWDTSMSERGESALAKVNDSLRVAASEAAAFPDSFMGAFVSLQDDVLNATQGMLSAEARRSANASFAGARIQAKAVAEGLGNATSEILEAISTGITATHQEYSIATRCSVEVVAAWLLLVSLSWT